MRLGSRPMARNAGLTMRSASGRRSEETTTGQVRAGAWHSVARNIGARSSDVTDLLLHMLAVATKRGREVPPRGARRCLRARRRTPLTEPGPVPRRGTLRPCATEAPATNAPRPRTSLARTTLPASVWRGRPASSPTSMWQVGSHMLAGSEAHLERNRRIPTCSSGPTGGRGCHTMQGPPVTRCPGL